MKKLLFVFLIFGLCGISLFAAGLQAEVVSFAGKAEYQTSAGWVSLTVGAKLDAGTVISTGFNSTAVLKVGDSRFTVAPLSRITISKLVESDSSQDMEMSLSAGKLNIDVKAKPGKTAAFTIRSPVATASIRGTSGDFYADGSLVALTGIWDFRVGDGTHGKVFRVVAGQDIKVADDSGTVVTPHQIQEENATQLPNATQTMAQKEAVVPKVSPVDTTTGRSEKTVSAKTSSLSVVIEMPEE